MLWGLPSDPIYWHPKTTEKLASWLSHPWASRQRCGSPPSAIGWMSRTACSGQPFHAAEMHGPVAPGYIILTRTVLMPICESCTAFLFIILWPVCSLSTKGGSAWPVNPTKSWGKKLARPPLNSFCRQRSAQEGSWLKWKGKKQPKMRPSSVLQLHTPLYLTKSPMWWEGYHWWSWQVKTGRSQWLENSYCQHGLCLWSQRTPIPGRIPGMKTWSKWHLKGTDHGSWYSWKECIPIAPVWSLLN